MDISEETKAIFISKIEGVDIIKHPGCEYTQFPKVNRKTVHKINNTCIGQRPVD